MPRQNRVTPFGTILAAPWRGLFMGNRGILHDAEGRLGAARWRHPHWIICVLDYKGRRRPLMQPRAYTELFFLDEAAALAAGHRPCALCRRPAYERFREAWAAARQAPRPGAAEMDALLHRHRVAAARRPAAGEAGRQRRLRRPLTSLPDGSFIVHPQQPQQALLLHGDNLLPFEGSGYGTPLSLEGDREVEVLTPQVTLQVLSQGYRPIVHSSAGSPLLTGAPARRRW